MPRNFPRFPYNVPVNGRYGAPMGRADVGGPDDAPLRLTIRPVPFHDGCYDNGGAYWGGPADLWCAWSRDRTVIRWVRAKTKGAALEAIREDFPEAVIVG